MRILVKKALDFTPPGTRRIVAFTAGEVTTKRAWGEALVAAGVAEEIPAPGRPKEPES